MMTIRYIFSHIRGYWKQSFAAILFFAAATLSICAAKNTLSNLSSQLTDLKYSAPVTVTVTNYAGKDDGLDISHKVISDLTEGSLSEYIHNYRIRASLSVIGFDAASPELSDAISNEYPRLYGINRIDADPMFLAQKEPKISYCEGYSEKILEGDEMVCIASNELLSNLSIEPGDELGVTLRSGRLDFSVTKNDVSVRLKIVAIASGVPTWDIYCPWKTAMKIAALSDGGETYARSLSFELKDPAHTESFRKQSLENYLDGSSLLNEDTPESPLNKSTRLALRIEDSLYVSASAPLKENIATLEQVFPFLFGLTVSGCAAVSIMLTVKRKREFAILYALGFKRKAIVFIGAFECLLLTLFGVAAGTGAYSIINGEHLTVYISLFPSLAAVLSAIITASVLTHKKLIYSTTTKE